MVLKAWTAVKVSEIEDPAIKETFKEAVGTEDVTIGEALVYGCVLSACRGNSQMMRLIFELLEELPEVRQRDKEIKLKEKAAATSQNDDADVVIVLPEKERVSDIDGGELNDG